MRSNNRSAYVFRRGNVFHFRLRIPADLVARFDGRREVRLSLRTTDPELARYRALRAYLDLQDLFARLRAESAADPDGEGAA